MKPIHSISLKLWLPLILTGALILLLSIMTLMEYRDHKTGLIDSSLNFVTQDMYSIQHEMQVEYNNDDSSEAGRSLIAKGVNTHYKKLIAIDDQGTILHATQFGLNGQSVFKVVPTFDKQRYSLLQQLNRSDVRYHAENQQINAYFPLILKHRAGKIRPQHIGALFANYDLSEDIAEIWYHILLSSLPIWLLAMALLLMLIAVMHYFVTRPMAHLVATTEEIAKGNYGVLSQLEGQGEFAHLGNAFNQMSRQLEKRSLQSQQAEAALRKSEQRFRTLIESAPIAFYETDAQGNCLYVNEKWQQLAGLTLEESLGEGWQRAIHKEDRETITKQWYQHSTQHKPWDMEYRFCTPTGKVHWLIGRAVALRNEDDQITGYLGANIDITELKQTESALRRAQKMEAIGQLTGGIAHDFNNILGIILGNLELLETQIEPRTEVDDKINKRFETIKHSALRAADLTRQLLGFSRNEATSIKVTNINRVIDNMQKLIANSVTPQVDVSYELAKDLWPVKIDPADFQDVILNLVLNARDAMPASGKLSLETRNCHLDASYCALNPSVSPGDYVELAISDNGIGISDEIQDRIFEPFFSTKPLGKGTGLGLSMVFGFIKRSQGDINIYSEPNIGTTIRLFLPRSTNEVETIESESKQSSLMPSGKETILIVDDETALLGLVEEALVTQGYTVLTATNGRRALERLAEEPDVELLFSDVVMPGGMNGYELAEQALINKPQLKVLLTSGYTELATASNNQERFKANLLSKPYTIVKLTQRVREMLD